MNDGTTIPKGSNIEIAANAVNRDPSIHEDPDVFDGFRFYKMRQRSEEDANRHQFVSSSPNSLNWGYGRHACPGRFFAVDEIKVILSKVLQKYDIALVDPSAGRYKNTSFETMVRLRDSSLILNLGCSFISLGHPRHEEGSLVS